MSSPERIKHYLDCAEDRIYRSLWQIAFYELQNRYEKFPDSENKVLDFFTSPEMQPTVDNLKDVLSAIHLVRNELKIQKYTPTKDKPDVDEAFRVDFWNSVFSAAHKTGKTPMTYIYSALAEKLIADGENVDPSLVRINGLLQNSKSNHSLLDR